MNRKNLFLLIGGIALLVVITGGVIFSQKSTQSTQSVKGAAQENTSVQRAITQSDLKTHNSSQSCYISYKSVVYDITSFVPKHQGGSEIIQKCGTVVDDFSQLHPGGSFDSRRMQSVLSQYKIGTLSS